MGGANTLRTDGEVNHAPKDDNAVVLISSLQTYSGLEIGSGSSQAITETGIVTAQINKLEIKVLRCWLTRRIPVLPIMSAKIIPTKIKI